MRHLVSQKHKTLSEIIPKEMLESLKQMNAGYDEIKMESEFYSDQGN